MNVRDWLALAFAALTLLAATGYCQQWKAHARAEAKADQIQVALDSLKRTVAARDDSIAAVEREAERRRAELERRARDAADAAERARSRADSLAAVVRLTVPEDARPAFDSLRAAHAEEVRSLNIVIAAKDARIADLGRLNDLRARLRARQNADLQAALTRTEEQRDIWKRRARPNFLAQLGGDLPKLIGAAAVGGAVVMVLK